MSTQRVGRTMALWMVAGLALAIGAPAPAWAGGEIKEPDSGIGFPSERSWGSHRMRCVGTGLRRKYGFKVYAGCLYIDIQQGKAKLQQFLTSPKAGDAYKAGKLDLEKLRENKAFYEWLIAADLPISIDMTFLRAAPADKIRETYREGLGIYLKDEAVIGKFVALPDAEIQKFQHITLNLMPGGRVTLQYGAKTHPTIVSRPLARALLGIYFGHKPINENMKRGFVRRIDSLL